MAVLLFLSSCTEAMVQVNLLSEFSDEIDLINAKNSKIEVDSSEQTLPLQISCSAALENIQIKNKKTQDWTDVSAYTGSEFSCPNSKVYSVEVPVSEIAPYSVPLAPGDREEQFEIRWQMKELAQDKGKVVSSSTKNLIAQFKAPSVSAELVPVTMANKSQYPVEGTCSKDSAQVIISSTALSGDITVLCANKGFSATANLVNLTNESAVSFQIIHRSQAADTFRTFSKANYTVTAQVISPGSFSISGVRSVDNVDNTTDAFLRGFSPRIIHTSASEAISYQAKIWLGADLICDGSSTHATILDFSVCTLQPNTDYTIKMTAQDLAGNVTNEVNYSFRTDFPIPSIISIAAVNDPNFYVVNDEIFIRVKFDRSVTVTGVPRARLNFGSNKFADYVGVTTGDETSLDFKYVVKNGDATGVGIPLDVTSLELNSGTIKDKTNIVVNAGLTFTGPTDLYSANQKVDALKPAAVTGLQLTGTHHEVNQTPVITFTSPAESPLTFKGKVIRENDQVLFGWTPISSGQPILLPSSPTPIFLNPGERYRIEVRSVDLAGNESVGVSAYFYTCPFNYAFVSNALMPATPGFCVAKYEAKRGPGDFVLSTDLGVPWKPNTKDDAIIQCSAARLGPGYRLMSNDDWQVLANNVVAKSTNWTNGVVRNGLLFQGYQILSGQQPEPVNLGDDCWPNTSCATNSEKRRSHELLNGQQVWDLAGNAIEIVADDDVVEYTSAHTDFVTTMATLSPIAYPQASMVTAKYGTPLSCAGSTYCGFGYLEMPPLLSNQVSSGQSIIYRGGNELIGRPTSYQGIFSSFRTGIDVSVLPHAGFRCVYHR